MKGANSFSDSQLRDYANLHIAYEVQMLRLSASVLYAFSAATLRSTKPEGTIVQSISNAFLESFAVHSRNLIDFLYLRNHYKKDRPTDIILEDYVPADAIKLSLPPISRLLIDAKTKADKQVAHLASDRLRYGQVERSWFYGEVFQEITRALRRVAQNIPLGRFPPALLESLSDSLAPILPIDISTSVSTDGQHASVCISSTST
jgi:hypothetical protein